MGVRSHAQTVTLTTSEATTEAFRYTDRVSGRILMPSTANVSLTFYECDTVDGTYALCDDVGTNGAVTITAATVLSEQIPTALTGSRFIKMVPDAAGMDVTVITKTG